MKMIQPPSSRPKNEKTTSNRRLVNIKSLNLL
jgi:hypothetical protein